MSTHDSSFNDSFSLTPNLFSQTNSLFDENINGSDSFDLSRDDSMQQEQEYTITEATETGPVAKQSIYQGSMGNLPKEVVEEVLPVTEEDREPGYSIEDMKLFNLESELHSEDSQRARELREERDLLRTLNSFLSTAANGLDGVFDKLLSLEGTIGDTHALLNKYVNLNDQSQKVSKLINDEEWQGIAADKSIIKDRSATLERERMEQEALQIAQKEKIELAEREKKLEAMKKLNLTTGAGPSVRGRGVPRGRGLSSSTRPASASSSSSQYSGALFASAPASGNGRGFGIVRGVRGVKGLRSRGSKPAE